MQESIRQDAALEVGAKLALYVAWRRCGTSSRTLRNAQRASAGIRGPARPSDQGRQPMGLVLTTTSSNQIRLEWLFTSEVSL